MNEAFHSIAAGKCNLDTFIENTIAIYNSLKLHLRFLAIPSHRWYFAPLVRQADGQIDRSPGKPFMSKLRR